MFTVCPKCSLKLVVTAADLRVAQGYVRCGRCSNVFNALIGLSDEQQAVLAREAESAEPPGAPQAEASGPAAAERNEPDEHGADESAKPAYDAALEFDPSQTDVSEVFVEPRLDEPGGTGSFESITLRTEEEPQAEPPGPSPGSSPGSSPPQPRAETSSQAEMRTQRDAPNARPDSRLAEHGDRPVRAEHIAPPQNAPAPPRASPERRDTPPRRSSRSGANARAPERQASQTTGSAPTRPGAQPDIAIHELEFTDPASRPRTTAVPKTAPGATPTAAPASAPKTAPAATPKGAPAAAPKSAPATTPKAAPAVTPKSVPETATQRVASPRKGAWSAAQASPGARLAAAKDRASRVSTLNRTRAGAQDATVSASAPAEPLADASVSAAIAEALGTVAAPHAPAADTPLNQAPLLRVGVAILGVLLAAQVVHHYREALAELDWLRPPLVAIYAAVGMPLIPRWDVTAYEVHQLGAIAGAGQSGGLIVRASIKNTAPKAQPLPLLRVMLQDRYGNHVAARDVPPRAYLPASSAERAYLAPGQRVDAEVQLVDPGASAVGFEIDACLRDSSGHVSCANDSSGASVQP